MQGNETRRREIEEAALAVLAERGYRSTSMLQIAKRAKASNETLYAWYGSKQALFRSIIEVNGRAVRTLLERALADQQDPRRTLEALGPALLRFTTDRKAILMNRAAVADVKETGVLAQAIDEVARGMIFPLIRDLVERLGQTGGFRFDDGGAEEAAATYVSLLFGEAQLRQALGTLPPYDEETIRARGARAAALFRRIYGRP